VIMSPPVPFPNPALPPLALEKARAELALRDPVLQRVSDQIAPFHWRLRPGGFEGLLRMIVEQQVSVAAAAAIWKRTTQGLDGCVSPKAVLGCGEDGLRSLGLSRQKARYALEIATAQVEGRIDFAQLTRLDDVEAVARLTAIRGVGTWTAQTYLMFCEGRTDIFPAGDIALQETLRWADRLDRRPSEAEADRRARIWSPYRSVAAHMLWEWYGAVRRGEISLEGT